MSNWEDYSEAVIKNDLNIVKNSFKMEYLYYTNTNGFTAFLQACHFGYTEIVKFFIEKEVNLSSDTSNGWNGLHWAAGSGHVDIVVLLLERGVNKECETNKKLRPLHCAVVHDQVNTLRLLLSQGCDYNARNKDNKTPFDLAASLENEKCKSLLKKWMEYEQVFNIVRQDEVGKFEDAFVKERVNVTERNSGMTVIDVAVKCQSHGCLEQIMLHDIDEKVLLESLRYTLKKLKVSEDSFLAQYRLYKSIIFDLKGPFDEYALMNVINTPWILTGHSFLDICVQFNRKDMTVSTLQMTVQSSSLTLSKAENIATTKGFTSIRDILIQRRNFLLSRDQAGYCRIFVAIQDDRADVVKFMLYMNDGDALMTHHVVGSPLCFALSLGYTRCVDVLVDHGVSFNVNNKWHQTPLHLAVDAGLSQFYATLIDHTDDVDQRDCFGFTPLHQATIKNDDRLCRLLLDNNANMLTPLKILEEEAIYRQLSALPVPLLHNENCVTLSMKLHQTILPSLLDKINGHNSNLLMEDGNSFLLLAVKLLQSETCTQLINKGADVNLVNNDGNAPIHCLLTGPIAVEINEEPFLDTLRSLVNGGSDINLLNNAGVSPLTYALQYNTLERIAKEILGIVISRSTVLDCRMDDLFTLFGHNWRDEWSKIFSLQKDGFKSNLIVQSIDRGMNDLVDFVLGIVTADFIQSIVEECLYNCARVNNESLFANFMTHRLPDQPRQFPCGQTLLTRLIVDNIPKYSLQLAKSDLGPLFIDLPNQNGQTPLYLSAEMASLKLCKFLALESDSVDYEDPDGESALERLFRSSSDTDDRDKLKKVEEISKTLIRAGMDINRMVNARVAAISLCRNEALKKKLQSFNEKQRAKKRRASLDSEDEKNQCSICLKNTINCQFGCGHPICSTCADRLNERTCPTCRKPFTERIPLFLP